MNRHTIFPHTRGFVVVDMLFGLIIIGTVTIILARSINRQNHAEKTLADSTAALHLAEHALLNLQHGQAPPAQVTLVGLTSGKAPAGWAWAKVDAVQLGHHRTLIGIVPSAALVKESKP